MHTARNKQAQTCAATVLAASSNVESAHKVPMMVGVDAEASLAS